jgi:hypothetical protein
MKFYIIFLLTLLCGCASFEVHSPTGWSAKYSRFWDQELSDVYFHMDQNGTVEGGLGSQKTQTEQVLKLLLQTLAQGTK